jgi:hypothetical protein
MSEIQSLILRFQSLSHSVDWWNTAVIWGLALAAIAAVFVVIATRIVVTRTRELSAAQDLLSEAKDRERDVKIAEAQRGVADANARAGAAIERASKADERASKNEIEAARLTKEAEDERMARIQLAASISWRTPDRALITQLAPPLQRFAGQRFAFVSEFSDPERNNVLSWIGMLLGTAEWRLEASPPSARSELTFQATNIVLWVSPTAPNVVIEAARALVPALEQGGLPTVVLQSGWGPKPDAAPPDLIRVVIFKKGPRMTVTGNMITFEGLPTELLFGDGPPH